MPRLILSYPDGAFGLALLLLRLSQAFAMLPLFERSWPAAASGWPALAAALLVSLCLVAGLFTRSAALLLFAAFAAALAAMPTEPALLVAAAGGAAALTLLGPGAYSIDARRFGRRVIRLEPRSPDQGSTG